MSVTPDPFALNDAQIITSWRTNAVPWSTAVRGASVGSTLLTHAVAVTVDQDSHLRNAIRGPVAAPSVPADGQRRGLPYAFGDRNANPNATFTVLPDPVEPTGFPASCLLQ